MWNTGTTKVIASGFWSTEPPNPNERRVAGLVHETSTMWIGNENDETVPVGLDY